MSKYKNQLKYQLKNRAKCTDNTKFYRLNKMLVELGWPRLKPEMRLFMHEYDTIRICIKDITKMYDLNVVNVVRYFVLPNEVKLDRDEVKERIAAVKEYLHNRGSI
jgi:hypothetical protein